MSTFSIGGDLKVNRIGYGAMRLADGDVWTGPADRGRAVELLRRVVDRGVNLIDTADAYALGANEELIAEALCPYPSDLVIVTKAGVARPGPALTEWVPLGRPEYLRQQAELSLRRLRLDRIDLFLLHRLDPAVPLEDQLGALTRLQAEGKVRHIGLSEVTAEELARAREITEISAVQNLYNLSARHHEPVLDQAAAAGIAFMPFFPIATGDHARSAGPLAEVAAELGATPAQTALAWLLRRSPVVLPIPGTTSAEHLEDNIKAAELVLSDAQFARLSDGI